MQHKHLLAELGSFVDAAHKQEKRLDRLPAVTIARMAGARGTRAALELKSILDEIPYQESHWLVFSSNLAEMIVSEYLLPEASLKHLQEKKNNPFEDLFSHILGQRPSDKELYDKTLRTVRHLLRCGNSIVVGRGANYMASDLGNCVHVLLRAGEEAAVKRLAEDEQISVLDAARLRIKRNAERRQYVQTHLKKDIFDEKVFDLVIDTDNLSVHEVALLIADAVKEKKKQLAKDWQ